MSDNLSSSFAEMPSPPAPVHVPSSRSTVTRATGTHLTPLASKRILRRKNHQRANHDFDQPVPKNSVVAYLENMLEREGSQCVFLLWGPQRPHEDFAWAVDVRVADSDKEEEIFLDLKHRFLAERGFWHRYLSLRSFKRLKPVVVCSKSLSVGV